MAREITITDATAFDASRIARLLMQWFEVSSIPWPEPIPTHLVGWVLNTIESGYVVVAKTHDGFVVGAAAVEPFKMPWNPHQTLMKDVFFFVREQHDLGNGEVIEPRKLGVPDALITALKLYCAKRGKPLMMGIITGTETEKLERWYQIRGGKYAGGTMVFGMNGSGPSASLEG